MSDADRNFDHSQSLGKVSPIFYDPNMLDSFVGRGVRFSFYEQDGLVEHKTSLLLRINHAEESGIVRFKFEPFLVAGTECDKVHIARSEITFFLVEGPVLSASFLSKVMTRCSVKFPSCPAIDFDLRPAPPQ